MRIFDVKPRTDSSPKALAEPAFGFLNRSSRPEFEEIRLRIEDWLSHYPNDRERDLVQRLRSMKDSAHYGAVFELFVHELLVRLGCSVEVHPTISATSRTPDFLATMGGESVLVEATEVRPKASLSATDPLEDNVLDAINELDSPNFFLDVSIGGHLVKAPPHAKVVEPFKELMSINDPDDVAALIGQHGPGASPSKRIELGGWWIEASLMPKFKSRGNGSTRTIGMGPGRAGWSNDSKPLRNALREKAAKYRRTGLPLVVAVNAPDVDEIDETEALFGREQLTFTGRPGDAPPSMTRAPDGVWIGPAYKPRHRSLSAVLIFRGIAPWSLSSTPACLYVNPFADQPVPQALLALPHALGVSGELVRSPGVDVGKVLGVT